MYGDPMAGALHESPAVSSNGNTTAAIKCRMNLLRSKRLMCEDFCMQAARQSVCERSCHTSSELRQLPCQIVATELSGGYVIPTQFLL